tara:strand:- start:55 stop:915 length:861 start_codon:yes stop_codon:yes gene_type:complete
MGLATKIADLQLQAGSSVGFQVGATSNAGFVKFDKNLAKDMTSNTFTVSAFFRLPGSVSSSGIPFFVSEFFDFAFSGDTRNRDGIVFRSGFGPDISDATQDRDFVLEMREPDGSGGDTRYSVRVVMGSNSIPNDVWHHIVISASGNTAKCYFNDSEITNTTVQLNERSTFTTDASHLFLVGGTMGGGGGPNNQVPVGNALGYQYQNIFLDNQFVDLDTASNRRIFLNADGTPTTGTPQISSTDPVLFISGNQNTVDNFENPGGAGSTHTVTRTNLFSTGINKIDVI